MLRGQTVFPVESVLRQYLTYHLSDVELFPRLDGEVRSTFFQEGARLGRPANHPESEGRAELAP